MVTGVLLLISRKGTKSDIVHSILSRANVPYLRWRADHLLVVKKKREETNVCSKVKPKTEVFIHVCSNIGDFLLCA